MEFYMFFILCASLLHQSVHGVRYRNFLNEASLFEKNLEDSSQSATDLNTASDTLSSTITETELYYNSSEVRSETTELLADGSSSLNDQTNSTSNASVSPQTVAYISDTSSLSTHKVTTSMGISSNESLSSTTVFHSPSESFSTAVGGSMSTHSTVSSTKEINGSSPATHGDDDDEPEDVARGKPSTTESINVTTSMPETIYQKTLALINDTYALSILVPVAAGIVFATTIIMTIAICRCLRRKCRQRRLRRKALPDSVKNLRPSDKARLLAESSDEEF